MPAAPRRRPPGRSQPALGVDALLQHIARQDGLKHEARRRRRHGEAQVGLGNQRHEGEKRDRHADDRQNQVLLQAPASRPSVPIRPRGNGSRRGASSPGFAACRRPRCRPRSARPKPIDSRTFSNHRADSPSPAPDVRDSVSPTRAVPATISSVPDQRARLICSSRTTRPMIARDDVAEPSAAERSSDPPSSAAPCARAAI